MSNLPKGYQVCKIKINKPKKKKLILRKKIIKPVIVSKLNTSTYNVVDNINNSIILNITDTLPSTPTTTNNVDNISLLNNEETVHSEQYISITMCYNFRVTNLPIDKLDSTCLIGTMVLTNGKDNLPVFKIDSLENIKYKKMVREKTKELWNIKNKYILAIKHINNCNNFHNYLVLLDYSNKSVIKCVNKIKLQSTFDEINYYWRKYLGMYNPNNAHPSKKSVYSTIAKSTLPTIALQVKSLDNVPCSVQIKDIYKAIGCGISDEIY